MYIVLVFEDFYDFGEHKATDRAFQFLDVANASSHIYGAVSKGFFDYPFSRCAAQCRNM